MRIKLKSLLKEIVSGRHLFSAEKFATIVVSELNKRFISSDFDVQVAEATNLQMSKHKAFSRSDIHNSEILVVLYIDYKDYEYELRILCKFKKVPDEELSNKFTMADDDYLRKMPYSSLEPKDLNVKSPLLEYSCRLKRYNTDTVLIPHKKGYAILFDEYSTLNDVLDDVKKCNRNRCKRAGT